MREFCEKLTAFLLGITVGLSLLLCTISLECTLIISYKVDKVQQEVLDVVSSDQTILVPHRYSSAFYGQLILDLNKAATRETLESLEYSKRVTEAKQINQDVAGWITIPDFEIDYPVLYSTNNKTYLRTDINGEYDVHGCIYLDSFYGNIYSPTKLIHGHNMRDGTMFAPLPQMLKWETLDEAPHIFYYDDLGLKEFQIFSVFSVNSEEESVLVDEYSSLQELLDLKQSYIDRSWTPCNVVPDGTELLMLNTCWYGESGTERHLHCIVVSARIA